MGDLAGLADAMSSDGLVLWAEAEGEAEAGAPLVEAAVEAGGFLAGEREEDMREEVVSGWERSASAPRTRSVDVSTCATHGAQDEQCAEWKVHGVGKPPCAVSW